MWYRTSLTLLHRALRLVVWPGVLFVVGCASTSASAGRELTRPSARPQDLTGPELRVYDELVERLEAPCASEQPLAQCLASPQAPVPGCHSCADAADFVAASIRAGFVSSHVEARYRARFSAAAVREIDLRGVPIYGAASAPVTIVEFADMQCSACAMIATPLHALVESYQPHVRLAFKHFPLSQHPQAEVAAQAAVAAQRQGKFWPMHDLMLANNTNLQPADLEGYARRLGLDVDQFIRDRDSEQTVAFVKSNIREAVALGVRATPTVFINGRYLDPDVFSMTADEIVSWIELELRLKPGLSHQDGAGVRAVKRDPVKADH